MEFEHATIGKDRPARIASSCDIRGIERRKIFGHRIDYADFMNRLAMLIPETQTACYAWVLVGNHTHFLLRSGPYGIAGLMRRLLTGYVLGFNRRHKRHNTGVKPRLATEELWIITVQGLTLDTAHRIAIVKRGY